MLVVDGHLDLASNALEWNRDLRVSALETRRLEGGMTEKGRAAGTVAFPEMRQGQVGICLATLFARVGWPWSDAGGYRSAEIAHGVASGHLAYYRQLAAGGGIRLIPDRATLDLHVRAWGEDDGAETPLGLVISMEGADPIIDVDQVPEWWEAGLRVLSLCHYGVSAYAHGTGSPGGLLPRGRDLLRAMGEVGLVLDVSHLAEAAFYEALEAYQGPVLASHNNCRALVPGDRQLTDDMIRRLVERDAVIGAAMDAWMLYPGWVKGQTSNQMVNLEDYVDHVDHVCQVAGNARHAGIGTDLDGGYGWEQCPHDLKTIADLGRIPDMLARRGYSPEDVESVMHGNWIRLLREALPAG